MNTATLPLKRNFNALTGSEIIDAILKEFREQLEADDNLQGSLTYPIIEWTGELRFRAYPRTPEKFEVKAAGQLVEYAKTENGEVPAFSQKELGRPVIVEAKIKTIVDQENPPDMVREQHGLPVSMPEKSEMLKNVIVDRPRIRPLGPHHKVEPGD